MGEYHSSALQIFAEIQYFVVFTQVKFDHVFERTGDKEILLLQT